MKLTYNQKDDFIKYFASEVIQSTALEESIYWIKQNLEPDDVFDKEILEGWAEGSGYIKS